MDRIQLENLYKVNGLTDYKLKTTDDLLKVHGIDYELVKGYGELDDLKKAIYKKFILNIFNTLGLDNRSLLIPRGIYWVEEYDYLVKENPEQDYYNIAGGIIYAFNKDGSKKILGEWIDENYKHLEKIIGNAEVYLRFEYQKGFYEDGKLRYEWLHIIKGGREWY